MRSARAKGSKEDGTNLTQGVSQPSPATVTHPHRVAAYALPVSAALPKADVNSPPWLPPLSAKTRREQVQQLGPLFDYLIGAAEQHRWDGETDRFGGL